MIRGISRTTQGGSFHSEPGNHYTCSVPDGLRLNIVECQAAPSRRWPSSYDRAPWLADDPFASSSLEANAVNSVRRSANSDGGGSDGVASGGYAGA